MQVDRCWLKTLMAHKGSTLRYCVSFLPRSDHCDAINAMQLSKENIEPATGEKTSIVHRQNFQGYFSFKTVALTFEMKRISSLFLFIFAVINVLIFILMRGISWASGHLWITLSIVLLFSLYWVHLWISILFPSRRYMVLNGCQAAGGETAQLTKRAIFHFISQSVCICAYVHMCVCLNAILLDVCFILMRRKMNQSLLHY